MPDNTQYKLKALRKIAAHYKWRCKILKGKARETKKQRKLPQGLMKSVYFQKLSPTVADFIESQIKGCGKKPKGRRYIIDDKVLALSFFKYSSKAYRLLRKTFVLPSRKTLSNLLTLCLLDQKSTNIFLNT